MFFFLWATNNHDQRGGSDVFSRVTDLELCVFQLCRRTR